MTLPIITQRLILRRFTPADAESILAFLADPAAASAVPEIQATEAGVQRYIRQQNAYEPFEQDRCFDLAIERLAGGQFLGLVTLVRREHRQAEIGWALGAACRGQGYATEAAGALVAYAFEVLNLHRIQAETTLDNASSWRIMERLGMRREGHLRQAEWQGGTWSDLVIYGLLASEWPGPGIAA